jgi:hypothetical protein
VSEYIPAAIRRLVRERAQQTCEYCLIHETDALLPHEPDHIVAVKHRGETNDSNLAWTCFTCNRAKSSDLSSIDIETKKLVRLFNPRVDVWGEHFRLERSGKIIALTDVARVTEFLLKLNKPEHVEIRRMLNSSRRYPK